jgi:hypothetical protein
LSGPVELPRLLVGGFVSELAFDALQERVAVLVPGVLSAEAAEPIVS